MNARASTGGTHRDVHPSWYVALSTQLYSRLDTRAVPERDPFATDVDGYFAHLTRALLDPTAFDGERRHLTRHDVDVLGRLHASCNGRVRYTLQRGPHDALVSSVAMFELPPAASGRRAMTRHAVDEPRMGRGPGYYQFTFGYAEPLATLRERIGGVLERLSLGYGKYLAILAHLRGGSVDLREALAGADILHVTRVVDDAMSRLELQEKQDAFLDLYGEWKRTGGEALQAQLKALADEIRQLNPLFPFESESSISE